MDTNFFWKRREKESIVLCDFRLCIPSIKVVDTKKSNSFANLYPGVFKFAVLFEARKKARVAQLVEHNLAKVGVAGSNPVSRSTKAITTKL